MCEHEHIYRCEWLRPEHRRVFSLEELNTTGLSKRDYSLRDFSSPKSDTLPCVLLSYFGNEAHIRRVRGSNERIKKLALDVAYETGDSVIVAKQVGVDSHCMPLWSNVGRVLTEKADPMSGEAFQAWSTSIARRVLRASREDLASMSSEALDHLILDYYDVSGEELGRALAGYRTTIATPTASMMNIQRVELANALQPVLRASDKAAKRIPAVRANLATGFAVRDREVSRLLTKHHSFWVRNRHGDIAPNMSRRANNIIAQGVEQGLGRREIAAQLKTMTNNGLRQPGYWQTVAANHVARARSYSIGSNYRAAGIEYYRIESVLDDRTTHQCEFLHKKILPVGAGMRRMDAVLASPNPEAILWQQPFLNDRGNHISVDYPDGNSEVVARIDERSAGASPSGIGGSYTPVMSQSDMVDAAIGYPPYHHGCRTTTVPA